MIEGQEDPIAVFARACEEMNDYQRELWTKWHYSAVRSQEGIRNWSSGWRLEKWVEVDLNVREAQSACWWLELQPNDSGPGWIVLANVSISHSSIECELENRVAHSVVELSTALQSAVGKLRRALDTHIEFKTAVAESKRGRLPYVD
jgi:hypothetical protein